MKAPERSLAPIWGAKSGKYKATMRGDNALPHLWRTTANAARQTLRTKKFIPRHPVRAGVFQRRVSPVHRRTAKRHRLGAPHSFMARRNNRVKASNRAGTASGISVACGIERATSGTIHSAAKIVFSQGAKPRANPSSAK